MERKDGEMTVWTLLYREVLVENYIGLRDMWRKRTVENGGI